MASSKKPVGLYLVKNGKSIPFSVESNGDIVSVDRSQNTNVPASVTNVQTLVNALGKMAFHDGYTAATQSTDGLLAASDKKVLDEVPKTYVKHLEITGQKLTFTRGDGTIGSADIPDNSISYTTFHGASATDPGTTGLVPAPANGEQGKYLRGDGTWGSPENTTYGIGSAGSAGLTKLYSALGTNSDGTMTQAAITEALNTKAASAHKHGDSELTSIDGSKIIGTIPLSVLPPSAVDILVHVANTEARLALTIEKVQNGDTVQEDDTGLMYRVIDDQKLNSEDGYQVYTAGAASSVPWSGITGVPSTFTASPHTHAKADIGLANVDNTADSEKSVKYATTAGSASSATKATNDTNGQALTSYIKGVSIEGRTVTVTKGDGSNQSFTTQDTNTTYGIFGKATANAAGSTGLVPAPSAGSQDKFLRGDGAWATPASYTHPGHTAYAANLYKVTVDALGHVTAATAVTKNDITALGIPASNTTYPISYKTINGSFATAYRTQTKGNTASGDYISTIRNDTASVANAPQHGSGLAWGRGDTHGYLYVNYSTAEAYLGGGNADKLNWVKKLLFADGTGATGTWNININGTATYCSNVIVVQQAEPSTNCLWFKTA